MAKNTALNMCSCTIKDQEKMSRKSRMMLYSDCLYPSSAVPRKDTKIRNHKPWV